MQTMNEPPAGIRPASSVAIQAGGRSSRFGRDKGLALLAGKPLIEHVIARVEPLASDLFLTTNNPDGYRYLGLRMAGDQRPGAGALEGVRTALSAAEEEQVLLIACDMPFLSRGLLLHLFKVSANAAVTVPRWDGQLQPLCAVYSVDCLPLIDVLLAGGEQRVLDLFDQVEAQVVESERVAEFDPQGLSFFNVNTPEDLRRGEQIYAELGS